ncbi:MAG: hypothetical protein LBS66_02245 [Rhodospirillaceae bacterium]|jgi:hypothetical protein|nr:hypothetical protein [Rhodospirillaceae bacterium]
MVRACLVVMFLLFSTSPAFAPIAGPSITFDPTQAGHALEQITEAQKQFKIMTDNFRVLNELKAASSKVHEIIGMNQKIVVPILSLKGIIEQAKADRSCLLPSIGKFGFGFKEFNTSVCTLNNQYHSAFFYNPSQHKGESLHEQNKSRDRIARRRDKFFNDTATRSLAIADKEIKATSEIQTTTDQLQDGLDKAETMQDRVQVIGQVGIVQLRILATQNQLLAQLLKVMASDNIHKSGIDSGSSQEEGL